MNVKTWVPLGVAIVLGGIAAKVGRDMLVAAAVKRQSSVARRKTTEEVQ